MDFTQPWKYGDVTFVVEGRKIHVNKGVLGMSSEVFSAMFTSEFKEKGMTEIPLPDKKFDDFLIFMQILHPLPNICVDDSNVESLLQLADEYQVHRVIKRCEKILVKQPASIHKLILADRFSLIELRQVFMDHLKNVTYSQLKDHPEIKLVDKATHIEVFERQAMFQELSIKNFFLAEKYKEAEVYAKCLQNMKDKPLSTLKAEPGFRNLKADTLNEVLNYKVETLETQQAEICKITAGKGKKEGCCMNCFSRAGTKISCVYCKATMCEMIRDVMTTLKK